MPSNTTGAGSLSAFACCLPIFQCLPKSKQPPLVNPRGRYNAQVRSHLLPPPRPLFLSTRAEYDPEVATPEPVQTRLSRNSRDADGSGRQASTPTKVSGPGRFPTTASVNVANDGSIQSRDARGHWATSPLSIKELIELFTTIHQTLAHVPYAICGLGALVDHGFAKRRVTQLSLLCPSYAKDNVRAWLASRGFDTFGDSVGVPVGQGRDADGRRRTRRVRIKYLDEGFDRLQRVRSSLTEAWILGLASQLDHAAAGYVDHYRRLLQQQQQQQQQHLEAGGRSSEETQAGLDATERALRTIARDVFFCLDKAARTRQRLDPGLLPSLLSEAFWAPFTARHAEARPEMARAGIDVAGVLARHRDERAILEHEEMLRRFGGAGGGGGGSNGDGDGDGDGNGDGNGNGDGIDGTASSNRDGSTRGRGSRGGVVGEQPRGFEGMRVLGDSNTKSVYSVAASSTAYGFDREKELPPMPPVPANLPPPPRPAPAPRPASVSVRSKGGRDSKVMIRVKSGLARNGSGRAARRESSNPGARREWI
ncbi:hypothetical protein Hte_012475 [Hypoxylon texense]